MAAAIASLDTIFCAAIEIASEAERAAYLAGACGDDDELRGRVAKLVAAHFRAGSFLEEPASAPEATAAAAPESASTLTERPGTVIGPYKLLQQIGEGGMGTVFMAEQTQPVQRKVALKVIKAGMDSRQVLARFEAERQALALMDHPNIAKVLEAGTTDSGRPYFVMELVKGVPITQYCDEHYLTPRERLELFIPVCQAVQHAHHKGIIHRDLKPSNVLIALYDGKPVPKVIDFGVAKAAGPKLTERTLFTEFGAVVGTLEYMSPEQAELNQLDIDTRSDVYSLGVLLYELVTGTTPLEHKRLKAVALLEVLRLIREEEAPRPSMRLSTTEEMPSIAANRGLEPKQLSGLVRGELDWIVLKALEKDRNRRYETANSFAQDVQRYLEDESVQACPPSVGYRLRKSVRRNKAALATASLVAVALLVGTAVSVWQAIEANRARRFADEQRQRAEGNFALARQAVDDMYTEVAAKWLAEQPRMTEVQRQFLQKALQFYQDFAREESPEPAMQLARARAYLRVGWIQLKLGAHAEAETAFSAARHILEPLATQLPTVPEYRQELAISHHNLGLLLRDLGKRTEAEMAYRAALKLSEPLAADFPAVPRYRLELAISHHNLAVLLDEVGRRAEAKAAFHDALKILEELVAKFSTVPKYRYQLAQIHNSLGGLLHDLGKPAEAETAVRAALKLQQRLADDFPTVTQYRVELATSYGNLGNLLKEAGRNAEAETALQAGLKLHERLATDFPAVPEYRQNLASWYNNLGLLLKATGQPAKAETAYRDALKLQEQLVVDFPAVLDYAVGLGGTYCNLAVLLRDNGQPQAALDWCGKAIRTLAAVLAKDQRLVTARLFLRNAHWARADALLRLDQYAAALPDFDRAIELAEEGSGRDTLRYWRACTFVRTGQTARAVAEADSLTQGKNVSGEAFYNAACIYGQVADALKDNRQQAENCAIKAIAVLRRAQAAGLFRDPAVVARLKQAPIGFDTLRSREDYQRLIQELEEKTAKGDK